MKSFIWLFISVFFILSVSGQVYAADNTQMAWNDNGWGNTDFGKSNWDNTGWGSSNWGNTDWKNTDWGDHKQYWQGEKPIEQLMKVTLGIKKPNGFCSIAVAWEKSSEDAITAIAKNCQDCTITNLANSVESAESFCQ